MGYELMWPLGLIRGVSVQRERMIESMTINNNQLFI